METRLGSNDPNGNFGLQQHTAISSLLSAHDRAKQSTTAISNKKDRARAILETYSLPADASARSFISLPSEIRNQIYDLLYVLDEQLFVWDTGARWGGVESEAALNFGLLFSCRQVYWEAASVLYQRNHFFVSSWYEQAYFKRWSEQLGPRAQFLRHVTIDYTALSSELEEDHGPTWVVALDLLPLLRLLWTESGAMLQVSIETPSYNDAPAIFNNAFRSIAQEDQLNLRRYSNLLASVILRVEGTMGTVTFASTTPEANVQSTFSCSDEGKLVTMSQIPRKPELSALPASVYHAIIAYAVQPTVKLFASPLSTILPPWKSPVFRVNRKVRSDALYHAYRTTSFVFMLASEGLRPNFGGFSYIERLRMVRADSDNEAQLWPHGFASDVDLLARNFQLLLETSVRPEDQDMDDVRINIIELLRATYQSRPSMVITVRLRSSCDVVSSNTQSSFTLKQLRLNVFVVLSQVFEDKDYRKHGRCPAVYINGKGHPVELVYHADDVIRMLPDQSQVFKNQESILKKAKRYKQSLRYQEEFLHPEGCISLGKMWDSLTLMIWPRKPSYTEW
ncbi:uncharacterized protein J4E84_010500 [Alternaria hordeiaustralica]|uniref:uncharacterized protein n=1 Tax=Alternaria hordeiaustralica TaxID=1187925 RepID=UPI0020C227D3|nr:uncharacterized protein J4E84_010500 [Alternaria hordeiaustralica]KAI4674630.1 hypothetical protein J4E84_010500 [Alternaria hordeiaustralica]